MHFGRLIVKLNQIYPDIGTGVQKNNCRFTNYFFLLLQQTIGQAHPRRKGLFWLTVGRSSLSWQGEDDEQLQEAGCEAACPWPADRGTRTQERSAHRPFLSPFTQSGATACGVVPLYLVQPLCKCS